MKGEKEFNLSNGKLRITNSEIKLKFNELKYLVDFIKLFGLIGLIMTLIKKVKNFENIEGFYENTKFIIFALASLILIYFFLEILFKRIWVNSISLENLERIEIYYSNKKGDEPEDDDKIEIELFSNNKRSKKIKLLKKERVLKTILEELKTKNTRLKIEFLN